MDEVDTGWQRVVDVIALAVDQLNSIICLCIGKRHVVNVYVLALLLFKLQEYQPLLLKYF